MFIRRTQTRSRMAGQPYVTYRLVQSARVGGAVKQTTLLNLGSHFDLPQAEWPALAQRIDELMRGQGSLLGTTLSDDAQALAARYAAQLIALQPSAASITPAAAAKAQSGDLGESLRYQEVDLDSIELVRPRSVGVEHAALSVMRQCGLEDKLAELGLNRLQIAAAVGNIIGRMAHPGSELATHAWLGQRSALGELIGYDFEAMDLNRLYRASDALYKHREALQDHLFAKAKSILGFGETVTLYDLTNTYFEGIAAGVAKAKRGHSKESRSDCPLVTLAIVLDGSGFPRRSHRLQRHAGQRHHLDQTCQTRQRGRPLETRSGRVLPAHDAGGAGQRHAVAHLYDADQPGVGVPVPEDRPGLATGVPPVRACSQGHSA